MEEEKISYIVEKGSSRYPRRMEKLSGMPGKLYVKGTLPKENKPTIALVGARMCSSYGRNIAQEFARIFSEQGVQVISGLALGIDGEAHVGALKGSTPTYAVLACDVNQCYPASNRKIYEKILATGGGIISEKEPGTPALPAYFPARNRIISALADIVVVVEARRKSGSLITADYAMDQGKTVYAIPGRVGDALSEGCNRLIAQGVGIAWSVQAVLDGLSTGYYDYRAEPQVLTKEQEKVMAYIDQTPVHIQELMGKCKLPLPLLLPALAELEMLGQVSRIGNNYYVKSPKM